jgi:hypothetical protein
VPYRPLESLQRAVTSLNSVRLERLITPLKWTRSLAWPWPRIDPPYIRSRTSFSLANYPISIPAFLFLSLPGFDDDRRLNSFMVLIICRPRSSEARVLRYYFSITLTLLSLLLSYHSYSLITLTLLLLLLSYYSYSLITLTLLLFLLFYHFYSLITFTLLSLLLFYHSYSLITFIFYYSYSLITLTFLLFLLSYYSYSFITLTLCLFLFLYFFYSFIILSSLRLN